MQVVVKPAVKRQHGPIVISMCSQVPLLSKTYANTCDYLEQKNNETNTYWSLLLVLPHDVSENEYSVYACMFNTLNCTTKAYIMDGLICISPLSFAKSLWESRDQNCYEKKPIVLDILCSSTGLTRWLHQVTSVPVLLEYIVYWAVLSLVLSELTYNCYSVAVMTCSYFSGISMRLIVIAPIFNQTPRMKGMTTLWSVLRPRQSPK
jgi:hypothetical protein